VGEIERALRRVGRSYLLGVNATHHVHFWNRKLAVSGRGESIAQALGALAWQRLSAGQGTKGSRDYDRAYLKVADFQESDSNKTLTGTRTRGLMIRGSLTDKECALSTT
jgi:SRSO17 transposase